MNKIFNDKTARILSTIFVPPSFTIIIYSFLALHYENQINKILITILTAFIFGFLLQVILFFYLRKKGKIVDLDASVKEERTSPFLISILFYLSGLIIFIYSGINIVSIGFWFCYISNTLIVIFINRKWKISVHAAGAAGPLAAITFVIGPAGIWFTFLLIAVGWARIKLKCHTLLQVVAGAALGFVSAYIQLFLITRWF